MQYYSFCYFCYIYLNTYFNIGLYLLFLHYINLLLVINIFFHYIMRILLYLLPFFRLIFHPFKIILIALILNSFEYLIKKLHLQKLFYVNFWGAAHLLSSTFLPKIYIQIQLLLKLNIILGLNILVYRARKSMKTHFQVLLTLLFQQSSYHHGPCFSP